MTVRSCPRKAAVVLVIFNCCLSLSGCNQAEDDLLAALQSGLTTLQQNKQMAEQGVRDIKAGVKPSDPNYAQAMDDYEKARYQYGQYLDGVEDDHYSSHEGSARDVQISDVQTSTTDFISDVLVACHPGMNPRSILRGRTIEVPNDLQATLHKLSKKSRRKIVENFDRQVRWEPWSDLE